MNDIDMVEALKSAYLLQGYWIGLILCGRELPDELKVPINIAQLVAAGEIEQGECVVLVSEMMANERLEHEAGKAIRRKEAKLN